MDVDEIFYTKTLATLYAQQGNLVKEREIYLYLLKKNPDRPDLIDALAQVEQKINQDKYKQDLKYLMERWVKLVMNYYRIKKQNQYKGVIS
jgi:hypothetical protein